MRLSLIQQFKGKPNIDAILVAIGNQLNDVEEFFGQIISQLGIQNAQGVQLDVVGSGLSQGRDGLSDDDYRAILQARIVQYQANGTVEDLIQIMLTLANAKSVQVIESLPANITVTAAGVDPSLSVNDIRAAMYAAKFGGVGLRLNQVSLPAFAFDANGTTTLGFDGGQLAGPF